jgi:hypothetical protein
MHVITVTRRTTAKPESTETSLCSALFSQLGGLLAVAGRRIQTVRGLSSRNGPPTRTNEQPGVTPSRHGPPLWLRR